MGTKRKKQSKRTGIPNKLRATLPSLTPAVMDAWANAHNANLFDQELEAYAAERGLNWNALSHRERKRVWQERGTDAESQAKHRETQAQHSATRKGRTPKFDPEMLQEALERWRPKLQKEYDQGLRLRKPSHTACATKVATREKFRTWNKGTKRWDGPKARVAPHTVLEHTRFD